MSLEALALSLLSVLAPAAVKALGAALDQGKSEEEALAAARAHLPARIDTTAEDTARHARILAEQAAARTRVSTADVTVARRLADSPMVTAEESASVRRLADHVAIVVGDSPLSRAVQEHIERTERSDEPTVELPLPSKP